MEYSRFNRLIIDFKNDDLPFIQQRARKEADKLRTDATLNNQVLRWTSNNRVPPEDYVEFAHFLGMDVDIDACNLGRDCDTATFLDGYRNAQGKRGADEIAEQRAEARAAMGPGVAMVNVITGERYTT